MKHPSWHTRKIEQILQELGTDPANGLTRDETEKRLKKYGYNQLEEKKGVSSLFLFLRQFNDFVIWVLIAAAIVSGIVKELDDAVAIIAIVIINAIIGFVEEFRAEKSIEALKKLSATFSTVIRSGEISSIPSREIVPGDVVFLEAGDYIPADGRLYSSFGLETQEASLTGESTPVNKSTVPLQRADSPISERKNMVFMGTSVTNGKGTCIIVSTGMQTELGKIAHLIQEAEKTETPLQRRLQTFGKKLVYLCLGIVMIVFLLEIWREDPLLESFLVSVSLAVAAIPEGLPAIVTIALALGVQRMVKRHALIRKLSAIEALGCVTVICTDKTGTLTQNEMTIKRIYSGGKTFDVSGSGYQPEGKITLSDKPLSSIDQRTVRLVLGIGVLCSNASLKQENTAWKVIGDPTEGAMLVGAVKAGISKESLKKILPAVSEIPFNSDRKKMSVIRNTPHSAYLVCEKGAPDVILKDCTRIYKNGVIKTLTKKDRKAILEENDKMAGFALRVLGVAFKPIGRKPVRTTPASIEKDMIFAGLLAMIDPPKPEVKDAVAVCHMAGITTIMITGDHKNTAQAIGKELGFLKDNLKTIDGMELNKLSDDALEREVSNIAVYARVSAEHKQRIVRAWKKRGDVVAMTGDGVNDAPAVKEASIGIAMGITGTDVTKEASDMIITDNNFASIVAAVEEGRGIYDNIRKSIHYLLSCNSGEIMTMLLASLFNLPIPLYPIQILWINIATDGLPALALGVDTIDQDIMKRRQKRSTEKIIDKGLGGLILFQGFLIASITLSAYLSVLYNPSKTTPGYSSPYYWFFYEVISGESGGNLHKARTVAFCVLVISQLFHAFNCRNARRSLFETGVFANKKLLLAISLSLVIQITIVYLPYFQKIFKVTPLLFWDWILVFGFSSLIFILVELVKYFKK
ncbi:MAG: cation-translocating P-type ATPase [Candidatus Loosdrechtia sp.]|uniref:cation-translocating P-type ATPase n=1 Tax=Candidatus Loosdrechtia sp. TaxID=3101272 RepID=UPI003A6A1906|nr:MAG: cation-translocating P-type ATPase [Candidatus Jettenia sp. AMX2]